MEPLVKISVLMAVYNPDMTCLLQGARSILDQTFPHFEFLIYDDGSSPCYLPQIKKLEQLDSRIHCFFGKENRGLAYALNQCLYRAKGTYVARMDWDDRSCPRRFEKQLSFLDTHPQYQWVGSNAKLIDERGVWGKLTMPPCPKAKDFLAHSPYIHPSVMFRKAFLIQNGGYRESPRFSLCEDYELVMRLHQNGGQGYNLPEPLLLYFENPSSYRRRTFRRGIRETKLRFFGFRALHILNPLTLCYLTKPLLVSALPRPVYQWIRRRQKGVTHRRK